MLFSEQKSGAYTLTALSVADRHATLVAVLLVTACNRCLALVGGELQQHIGDVLARRHQEAVRDCGGDVHHIAGQERVPFASVEPGSQILAGAATSALAHEGSAQVQHALAALDEYDVHDAVVLLGHTIRVTVEQAEPMVAVVRERLAG